MKQKKASANTPSQGSKITIRSVLPSVAQIAPLAASLLPRDAERSERLMQLAARDALRLWSVCEEMVWKEIEQTKSADEAIQALSKSLQESFRYTDAYMERHGVEPLDSRLKGKLSWREAAKYMFPELSEDASKDKFANALCNYYRDNNEELEIETRLKGEFSYHTLDSLMAHIEWSESKAKKAKRREVLKKNVEKSRNKPATRRIKKPA